MPQEIILRIPASDGQNESALRRAAAEYLSIPAESVSGVQRLRQSLDARGRQTWLQIKAAVFVNEPFEPAPPFKVTLPDVSKAKRLAVVVGAGPAGLFAALRLIELGVKPIVLERGKDVRARRRDLAAMNKEGIVTPESNYCFGEGGAGTYSDGKLYTRSTKRGDVQRILDLLVQFGADDRILYEAHPHIGTNKLPVIITAIRDAIRDAGGEVLFEKKLTDFTIERGRVTKVRSADGDEWPADALLLATGHSARDIFDLLLTKGLRIEFKPFALGVRIEHPQSIIDQGQYHCDIRPEWLPPAAYSLVQQVDGKGVFSFCMCPGGIIAPAATAPGEIVVNGWSPSKRNNPYANSGIVVNIGEKDMKPFAKAGPLAGVQYQSSVERKAFEAGGGRLVAPAQRLADFTKGIASPALPDCSYLPGIHSVDLRAVLPKAVHEALQQAFREFGRKIHGYLTNDAVVVATESRTSSPVRIPRDADTLAHPQVENLYPCAEGAGYAGGIVSAAMDGERVATQLVKVLGF